MQTTSDVVAGLAVVQPSILDIMHKAVSSGIGVDGIERLAALHERMMSKAAEAEFASAFALFQATVPPVRKTSRAKFSTKAGGAAGYDYAELDEVANTIRPHLAEAGLAYSWDSEVADGWLRCVCTVSHRAGHSRSSTFACKIEGNNLLSNGQATAATLTLARRYALIQALGLVTGDPDTDGHANDANAPTITPEQAMTLESMIDDAKADRARFCAHYGISSVSELPADTYRAAIAALEERRRRSV